MIEDQVNGVDFLGNAVFEDFEVVLLERIDERIALENPDWDLDVGHADLMDDLAGGRNLIQRDGFLGRSREEHHGPGRDHAGPDPIRVFHDEKL